MKTKDLEVVSQVLADAFYRWRKQKRGKNSVKRIRPVAQLKPYLQAEPDGCFVSIKNRNICGGIFSHTWGKQGWIGTFGVSPEIQNQGIGKELLQASINYLDKQQNVTHLGLETMKDSPKNIGFYCQMGFKPAFQTFSLIKPIICTSQKDVEYHNFCKENNIEIGYLSKQKDKFQDIFTRCTWLASKMVNGLDHRREMKIIVENKFGEVIILYKDDFIIGYAICRIESRYKNRAEPYLDVRVLVIDPDSISKQLFDIFLYECEKYGEEKNKTGIKIRINSSYWVAFNYLLEKGFSIKGGILRMIKYSEIIQAFDYSKDWLVLCSQWSM